MEFIVSKELVEKVLGYLQTRPLAEVLQLWNEIHQGVKPVDDTEKVAKVESANAEVVS